jgi:peroxiredoxin Q/BCP
MLSDESGEARKAYSVSRGLMGLSEGRVTFFVDSDGVVRYVTAPLAPLRY